MAKYKGKHRRGRGLKLIGWGPFPVPGEQKRLKQAEERVSIHELLATSRQ